MDEGSIAAVREAFVRLQRGRPHLPREPLDQLVLRAAHRGVSTSRSSTRKAATASCWSIAYPIADGIRRVARGGHHPRPRRCSATPRWPCTPTTSATSTWSARLVDPAAASDREIPIIADDDAGRPGVRHRRREGDAGARLSTTTRPASATTCEDGEHLHRRRHVNENGGAVRGPRPLRRAQEGGRRPRGARAARGDEAAQAARRRSASAPARRSSRCLSSQWYVKIKPLADEAIAAVERADEVRARVVDQHLLRLDAEHPRLVHHPPAVVGPPDPRVVRRARARRHGRLRDRPGGGGAREAHGGHWVQDPDVLDTWFSSALWPFSTLGWPETDPGAPDLLPERRDGDRPRHHLLLGRPHDDDGPALHGGGALPHRVPPRDGARREGREDVEDARATSSTPSTSSAVLRRPISRPRCATGFPRACRRWAPTRSASRSLRSPSRGATSSSRWTASAGYKAFCNKVWNAARFALMNLGDFEDDPPIFADGRVALSLADRWILSRLNRVIAGRHRRRSTAYHFSEAASRAVPVSLGRVLRLVHRAVQGRALRGRRARGARRPRGRAGVLPRPRPARCCTRSCPSSPRRSGRSCR